MYDKLSTKQILQLNKRRSSPLKSSFILWMHNIRSLHNVGAGFRSADAFGIKELILSGYTPVPPRPEISKTALGADKHVCWRYFKDSEIESEISHLKEKGYYILGLEQTKQSIMLHNFAPETGKICLILGNEITGIDEQLFRYIDQMIEIPQFGA